MRGIGKSPRPTHTFDIEFRMTRSTPEANQHPNGAWHVAVLEDDTQLRESIIVPGLRYFGFKTIGVATSAELYRGMLAQPVDMVVLDIGLLEEDGISVLKQLRELSNLGVVMITGNTDINDHLHSLAHGADAFLNKPVDMEILAATLHSVGRRMAMQSKEQEPPRNSGKWSLDTEDWCLVTPTGKTIPLTAPERCILRILMTERDQPVSRERLVAALTSDIYDFDPHRLEMMIHRLRRKAHAAAGSPIPLITLRGHGYLFQVRAPSP